MEAALNLKCQTVDGKITSLQGNVLLPSLTTHSEHVIVSNWTTNLCCLKVAELSEKHRFAQMMFLTSHQCCLNGFHYKQEDLLKLPWVVENGTVRLMSESLLQLLISAGTILFSEIANLHECCCQCTPEDPTWPKLFMSTGGQGGAHSSSIPTGILKMISFSSQRLNRFIFASFLVSDSEHKT